MTDLLFQTDSYLQEFEARVTGIQPEARAVILDKTAFYPSGGGQPCDFGVLTIDGVLSCDLCQKTRRGRVPLPRR
jgi:misacylated tRNA(Ala) deacylase